MFEYGLTQAVQAIKARELFKIDMTINNANCRCCPLHKESACFWQFFDFAIINHYKYNKYKNVGTKNCITKRGRQACRGHPIS